MNQVFRQSHAHPERLSVWRSALWSGVICVFVGGMTPAPAQPIDRQALVERHSITMDEIDARSPLSIGNGAFAFTADVTGLQTFPEAYGDGIPLTTMAEWGWHTFPNPSGITPTDALMDIETPGRGAVSYPIMYNDTDRKEVHDWLRANPHQTSLARIGLRFLDRAGGSLGVEHLTPLGQTLDLWRGTLNSRFAMDGTTVTVTTVCRPDADALSVRIASDLVAQGRLAVEVRFPYASGVWGRDPADWRQPDRHETRILSQVDGHVALERRMDDLAYHCALRLPAGATVKMPAAHTFHILPGEGAAGMDLEVVFSPQAPPAAEWAGFDAARDRCADHWRTFWLSGGAIDLSGSADPRWRELERRIVLSRYLTAIQSTQRYPPQETGLTTVSWHGKFHLEMHWWHAVHFALWGRPDLLERQMGWYHDILPEARATAQRQGYGGVRWPKMVGPDGVDAPSGIGPLLIWQQPHPIYYAELLYRADPTSAVLRRYRDLVVESAMFMADFARWDEESGHFALGPPLISAREFEARRYSENQNPAFELAYWRWGLRKAAQWLERLGEPAPPRWLEVADRMAPLPTQDGRYIEQESVIVRDGGHPCMLGALGILPYSPLVDRAIMARTLDHVFENWPWGETWGWDYPMMAFTAARLGRPDQALDALLIDTPKNQYLANGHNWQRPTLPLYLPGNGGLLAAVAMMAAGWDGAPAGRDAPGFPDDGSWVVRWEGLRPMP